MRFAVAAAALAVATACGGPEERTLPDLALPALADGGAPLELAALPGPTVVNLWATWCEPCRRELPDLQALADRRDDVRVVGVDIGEDAGPALAVLDELGVSFDQYADPRGELTAALEVVGLPATFVTDGSGRITWEHLGELDIPDLEAAVSEF